MADLSTAEQETAHVVTGVKDCDCKKGSKQVELDLDEGLKAPEKRSDYKIRQAGDFK